jgi:hypothetical protein
MSPDPDGIERPHWDHLTPKQRREMWDLIETHARPFLQPRTRLSEETLDRLSALIRRFRIEDAHKSTDNREAS